MITTSKYGWCDDKSDAEILNSLKDWVSSCDVDFKREALKKIDSAFALWGGRKYVAAVDLLDENEVFLKKSDWPYYALGIEILKARKHEFFNE